MTFVPKDYQSIGTISEVLSNSIIHEVVNDGAHTYLHLQNECRTQLPICSETQHFRLPLTDPNVDIVQFNKSVITLGVEQTNRISPVIVDYLADATLTAPQKAVYEILYRSTFVFVGLHHSAECIGSYSVYHNGKQISGSLQTSATQEAFIYHTYRTTSDIKNRKGIHSLWSSVHKYDGTSVCGKFVSLYDLLIAQRENNSKITHNFNFIIPFNDILLFECFQEYPNTIFGSLQLDFRYNPRAFVFTQVDPHESIKKWIHLNESSLDNTAKKTVLDLLKTLSSSIGYNYEYEQANNIPSRCIVGWGVAENGATLLPIVQDFTFVPEGYRGHSCYSTIVGCKQDPTALERDRIKYQTEPWVKPFQRVTYLPFTQSATPSGIYINQQTYLNNTTDFILAFPRYNEQITVSKNPMYTDLYLQTMGQKLPDQPLQTNDARFSAIMLNSSDLEDGEGLKEYVNSVSLSRTDATHRLHPFTDLTRFLVTLKVERPSALGLIFDGLDSKGQQVSVRLSGKPLFGGEVDEYYNVDGNPDLHPPPPVLFTVNDSFMIFNSRNGGQSISSDRDFNEVVKVFMYDSNPRS